MRIGQVSLSYRPVLGGQDTYIENLKKVFAEQGHANTVYQAVSFRHAIDREGVHAVPTPPLIGRWVRNFNWYYFNAGLRFFRRQLAREDVLIVHYAVHYPAVRFHPRVVILSHGIEWHTPADQWDDPIRARRARETFGKCRVVANDTEYLRFCGLDIAPGTRLFEEVSPGKWFIPNCVDTEYFRPVAPDPELLALKPILVPRNIYRLRGIHLAIDAFARLVAAGNSENYLVIIGKVVDANYYEGLLRQIADHRLADRVRFLGHVRWQDMPAKYAAGVCTLIPTLDCEGTSLSALESMACGTPVVATAVAGLKDLPCVHAAPNAVDLAAALAQALATSRTLAETQRRRVLETFNLRNWAEAWKRVLAQLAQ